MFELYYSLSLSLYIYIWGFITNPVLSITSSGEIGFSDHDIEASKMQGRARGRKGERKTYHINPYHHITMEFGGYLLNVAKTPTRARARKGKAQGVLSYQKATGIFDNPHIYIYVYTQLISWKHRYRGLVQLLYDNYWAMVVDPPEHIHIRQLDD